MSARACRGCGGEIPPTRRANARYCSKNCRKRTNNAAEKARDPERIRAYHRNYQAENAEHIKALAAEYRKNNAEALSEWKKNHYAENRERILSESRAQYAAARAPEVEGRKCERCGRDIPTARRRDAKWCSDECGQSMRGRLHYHLTNYGHTEFMNDPMQNSKDRFRRARALGYRSGLEVKVARELEAQGAKFTYEGMRVPFVQPAKKRHYSPDFRLENGVVIETKGEWPSQDRQKMVFVRECNPDLDVRLVFSNANQRISKQSRTRFRDWCDTHGFNWADKSIPQEWIAEPPNPASLAAISRLLQENSK